jgi:hypothetical protein
MAQTYSFPGPTTLATTTDGRKDIAGLVLRSMAGVARSGIFPRTQAALVAARSDMQVDVAAFEAVAVQFGGPILLANDGTVQAALAAAPPANSRIDVIYAKQNESAAPGTDADNTRGIRVVTGVAAAAPQKPALPTGAVELAQVLVPAGAVATNSSGVVITQSAQFTTTTGGVLWVRTIAERDAIMASGLYAAGLTVFVLADNSVWVSTGAAWRNASGTPGPTIVLGQVSFAVSAASSATTAITFPAGSFTAVPYMFTNLFTGAGGSQTLVTRAWQATASGASLGAWTGNGAATTATAVIQWMAVLFQSLSSFREFAEVMEGVMFSTVTCHTDGCGNEGIPLTIATEGPDPETGEVVKVDNVICGVCRQEITDIVAAA